jgi:aldose sugar dehydrogenase
MRRPRRISGIIGAISAFLLASCGGSAAPVSSPPISPRPSGSSSSASSPLTPPQPLRLQAKTTVGGLEVPWALAEAPDGLILINERPGRVRSVIGGQLRPAPALTLPVPAAPGVESGLLGLALHPGFPSNPTVYVYYTYQGASGRFNRVSRFTYAHGALSQEQVLLDGIRAGACCHFGGRLAFGPDGDLYITTGDAQQPQLADDVGSLNGKLLRLRDDGSIPSDNPFHSSPVYAFGFRNPEGLAWDGSGHLYVSDNGPTGDLGLRGHDEIDLIRAGAFYGWPLFAGNTPTRQPGAPSLPQAVPPLVESGGDTWAPSGMTFYSPSSHEQPTLLVATLRGESVRRLIIDPSRPDQVVSQEVVVTGYGRLRTVAAAPFHCLDVLTSNRDGRGNPAPDDDRLVHLCPS